jgi:hypothetical protein
MKKLLLTAMLAASANANAGYLTWDRLLASSPVFQEAYITAVADQYDHSSIGCIPKEINSTVLRNLVVENMKARNRPSEFDTPETEIALIIADMFHCKFKVVDSLIFSK